MNSINRQSMPPSFEETQDEDETQSPSLYQGNFVTLFCIYF